MAIYHLSIKIISRGKGKSAVAAAAYRAAEKITNEYDGQTHDYTRKGGVVHTEILLPDNAPTEYQDRAVLWNAVERIEKAKNSQLAREVEISLPKELTMEQNLSLVREYVNQHFVEKGMCADFAIHEANEGKLHAHVLLTMRPFNGDGTWGDKQKKEYLLDKDGNKIYDPKKRQYKCKSIPTTDWNEQSNAEVWRAAWEEAANRYLETHNHAERINHKSYERQGLDIIPSIKLGVAAFQMEKRGIRTDRGNINREIEISNQKLRQLKARLTKLDKWLKEEHANNDEPTLADIISNILNRQSQTGQSSRYHTINNLKAASEMLNFLTDNKIKDMDGLNDYLKSMIGKQFDIRDELRTVERRTKTLEEHIRQSGNYKAYRKFKTKYEKLYAEYTTLRKETGLGAKRKAQKALDAANECHETYRNEITMYDNAERYMRDVMQKHFDPKKLPPIAKWQAERESLNSDLKRLNQDYMKLKDETAKVEKIRSNVYDILRSDSRETQRTRAQDVDR